MFIKILEITNVRRVVQFVVALFACVMSRNPHV